MHKPRLGLVLQLFLRASRVQKKRAILTVASIAWGSLSLLLLLAFGEGLKIAEVSQILGKSEGAIKILQHRAIRRLRKLLDREES